MVFRVLPSHGTFLSARLSRWNNWPFDCLFKTGVVMLKVSRAIILHLSCSLAHSGVSCPVALGGSNKFHPGQLLKITPLAHSLRPLLLPHHRDLFFSHILETSSSPTSPRPLLLLHHRDLFFSHITETSSSTTSPRPLLLLHHWDLFFSFAFHTALIRSSFSFPYLDSENIVNRVTMAMFHFVLAASLSFSHPVWSLTIHTCSI